MFFQLAGQVRRDFCLILCVWARAEKFPKENLRSVLEKGAAMCYTTFIHRQSRKICVKCRVDGELSLGRMVHLCVPAIYPPHPTVAIYDRRDRSVVRTANGTEM